MLPPDPALFSPFCFFLNVRFLAVLKHPLFVDLTHLKVPEKNNFPQTYTDLLKPRGYGESAPILISERYVPIGLTQL